MRDFGRQDKERLLMIARRLTRAAGAEATAARARSEAWRDISPTTDGAPRQIAGADPARVA